MPHRILITDQTFAPGQTLTVEGEEAHHALAVRRLREGDTVELLDGRGAVGAASVVAASAPRRAKPAPSGAGLTLTVHTVRFEPPHSPAIDVCAATPKGSRADEMIDQLSQVAAASWRPLLSERTVVDPRETKLDRLSRIAREACKQCGRAWLLAVDRPIDFGTAIAPAPGLAVVLADASGPPYATRPGDTPRSIRLLIGPEGGWTPAEMRAASGAGAVVASFGPHAMRIETAAPVGAAIIAAAYRHRQSKC